MDELGDTTADVVVIGAGIAGMTAALHAARELKSGRVLLVSARPPAVGGSSPLARGGIAAAVGEGDSPAAHTEDTLAAGGELCDRQRVEAMTAEAKTAIDALVHWRVPFDRDAAGRLALGLEAAHGHRRIVHAGGDQTGAAVCAALARAVEELPRIELAIGELRGLERDDQGIAGMWWVADGAVRHVATSSVVLATGGLGQLFARTTNPEGALGAGLAYAHRVGATLADLEFVQFHPTALDVDAPTLPLLTEALRGEGARLVDARGRGIVTDHPLADLAPRDVVARAVYRARREGRGAFLDVSAIDDLDARFPSVRAACQDHDVDGLWLPVTPAAHFHMGGIATDDDGATSVAGLWACGEVACTGVHGANRLASNSLLEGLVFGARAGHSAAATSSRRSRQKEAPRTRPTALTLDAASPTLAAIRRILWEDVGIARNAEGLSQALRHLDALADDAADVGPEADALYVARLLADAALRRTESRGAHHRDDYPAPDPSWRRRLRV